MVYRRNITWLGAFFILFASVGLHKFLQLEVGEWGGLVNRGKYGHFSGDMGSNYGRWTAASVFKTNPIITSHVSC